MRCSLVSAMISANGGLSMPFAGAGTFTLPLAQRAKRVIGIEEYAQAVAERSTKRVDEWSRKCGMVH
jgi:tRNA G37 N-methylase Trm5